ncbi:S24 family peptidase [Salipiger thiooxidans]|uniref:S24 family peptidase n=1 Tax=Salipiger thiooxidans TaxID=282683 RepID=UPI001CFBDCF2|nr:S24 family peptidase [Salipiger thiooxidans]
MRTGEELREEVKALRERAGLSVRAAANLLGMSPSGYAHYEQRIKEPYLPMKIAMAIAEAYEPVGISREEVLALAQPGPSAKLGAYPIAESDARGIEAEKRGPECSALVPIYEIHASGGGDTSNHSEPEAHGLALPPTYLQKLSSSSPENLAIISMKGESMEPTLLDDDIVLLDTTATNLSYDGLFVLRFDDALHVKRVGRAPKKGHVNIISDNKDLYPPMMMPVDEIEAIGKVLWYGRKV